MKKLTLRLCSTLVLFITLATPLKVYGHKNQSMKDILLTKPAVELKLAERKLWIDHVFWTRSLILSDLSSIPDKESVLERLLRNQNDIGDSIKPYYGKDATDKLSKLLRDHIMIAVQVVDAAKDNNKEDLDKYSKLWSKNADDIVDFLSSSNPHWSKSDLKEMLYKHLELTTNETVSMINKDWKAANATFDEGENHMIKFADMLTNGIVKQFPEKFEK
ncbi:hypothetical protein [Clostridium cellulovorans]|uniref:Glycosyltransferase n=1 Tax=Clostridium cellulovorans (strain ATCC 35296 / DSM 3052 / OCM 3 / 743B) TaxID=573061 RepID=D9SMG0_CLOC7|nr:hypothetical protein [Clostridium cellulovorans]ADL53816.1 hypothetical protein Clocel_4155 [Clostridium cellulovorans 743B]